MITNVPTAADLTTISLQLYFNAWGDVAKVVTEFRDIEPFDSEGNPDWSGYIEAAQSELQATYTLILQSQEIGLKALIADVSPFLLIKRHEARPIRAGSNEFDFSDFATIDAADLVRVHNTFCATSLSPGFAEEFDKLRRARNKIAHLGLFNDRLEPLAILDLLFRQYRELYPGRRWLVDRLYYASKHRFAGYDFGGNWSETGAVLQELWQALPELTPEQYEVVFGRRPEEPRFICPPCGHALERHQEGNEPYQTDVPTAFMDGGDHVVCALCLQRTPVARRGCPSEDCEGDVIAGNAEWNGLCLTCGLTPEDVAER